MTDTPQARRLLPLATERRIGTFGRIQTIKFNGYEEQVAHLYDGMDLRVNF